MLLKTHTKFAKSFFSQRRPIVCPRQTEQLRNCCVVYIATVVPIVCLGQTMGSRLKFCCFYFVDNPVEE